jgi:hypothetical protein
VLTEQIDIAGTDGQRRPAVRLSIMDNGPGFSPKILARAFEPYVTSKAREPDWGWRWSRKSSRNTADASISRIVQMAEAQNCNFAGKVSTY